MRSLLPAKRLVCEALHTLPGGARAAFDALFVADVAWHGQHPVNDLAGRSDAWTRAWAPLLAAMPDLERRDDMFIAGEWGGGRWLIAGGHYCGTFAAPLFGIPPTGHVARLRYGEVFQLADDDRIAAVWTFWDLVGLMQQAGCDPLPPSPGIAQWSPAPRTLDGVRLDEVDPGEGAVTRALVEAMAAGLGSYDGISLESMGQERFWSPTMLWYGPAGIGANRRLSGFQDFHQRPFLTAFPDRKGIEPGKVRFGDGAYCASRGWPSIRATHAGPYLGVPPTHRPITMRVMDIWRREGDRLAENWVYIDLPHLLLQMDVDLFAHLRAQAA
jgi:predicted ester cyclase